MYSYLKGEKGEEREIERCYKKVVSTISIFLKIEVLQSLHGRKIILTTFSIFLIHYMVVNVITDVIFVCLSVCIFTSEPLGHCLSWDWTSFWWSLMEAILFNSDWRNSSFGDSLLPSLSIVFEGSGNCKRYENNFLIFIVTYRKNKTLKSWKYPMAIFEEFK